MTKATTLLILFCAAVLEAGGDKLINMGLQTNSLARRAALFGIGAVFLFFYGVTVNKPPWDFGRLLGTYVVLFFLIAQAIACYSAGALPSRPILLGGTLIVAGGLIIAFAQA